MRVCYGQAQLRTCNKELALAESKVTTAREDLDFAEQKLRIAESKHKAAMKRADGIGSPAPSASEDKLAKEEKSKRKRAPSGSPSGGSNDRARCADSGLRFHARSCRSWRCVGCLPVPH